VHMCSKDEDQPKPNGNVLPGSPAPLAPAVQKHVSDINSKDGNDTSGLTPLRSASPISDDTQKAKPTD
jgi:hypothetical protein